MFSIKHFTLSLLLLFSTFSLVGCGSGETSYSLADLQQLSDANASKQEAPQDIKTALEHLEPRYGVDATNSTALIDLDTSDDVIYTTVHELFTIVDGVLVLDSSKDVALGEYDVKITATDVDGKVVEKIISIVVVPDINLVPPLITTLTLSILENSTGDKQIAFETIGKGKVTSFTFAGGVDDTYFNVTNEGVLSIKEVVDSENSLSKKQFEIQLQASDDLGNVSPIQTMVISIVEVDEGYHFISQNNYTILDQYAEVGQIMAVVNDASMPSAEYDFAEPTTEFGIGLTTGQLRFANAVTYVEGGSNTYTVKIRAKNQYNGSETNSSTITIVVVPDYSLMKPIIDGYEQTTTRIPSTEVFVHVSAHSQAPDGNVTFVLVGDDADLFEVDSTGSVRFKSVEDFYNPRDADQNNVFDFAVEVTEDYGNMVSTQTISITLIEDPAKKKPIITATEVNIIENTFGHELISFVTPGTGVVNEYIIVESTIGSTTPFKFENGFLSFKEHSPDADIQSSYSVRLRIKDSFGNISDSQEVNVNIVDVDEHYNFTSQTIFSPTEGELVVGTVTVSPNVEIAGAVPVFSIATQTADGASTNKFDIDSATGSLFFTSPTVFNDTTISYILTVNVQSQFNGSDTISSELVITVLPKSRAITFTPQPIADVNESTTIYGLPIRATSSDPSATITYEMQDGTNSDIFSIYYFSGDMTIHVPPYKWSSNPESNIYRGAVVASDQFGNSKIQQGEMHVEKPFDGHPTVSNMTFNINENIKTVTSIQATSLITPTPAMSYSIIGGTDSSFFSIDPSSGALAFINLANYEYKSNYSVRVAVTDNIGHPESVTEEDVVVTLNDVPDAPTNIRFNDDTTTATAPDGWRSGIIFHRYYNTVTHKQLSAIASPSNGALSYRIKTNPKSSIFSMTVSGDLTIDAPYESGGHYDIEIEVTEVNGEVSSGYVRVTIVND